MSDFSNRVEPKDKVHCIIIDMEPFYGVPRIPITEECAGFFITFFFVFLALTEMKLLMHTCINDYMVLMS